MENDDSLTPGVLVVRRNRWHVNAGNVGIVISKDEDESLLKWCVMWTVSDQQVIFTWHFSDALTVVRIDNLDELMNRCAPVL